MKKKELEEIEDYELDPEIYATIRRNYRKAFNDYHKEKEEKEIRDKQRNKRLKVLTGIAIIVIVGLVMFANYKLMDNAKKSCIELGHSENYCVSKI